MGARTTLTNKIKTRLLTLTDYFDSSTVLDYASFNVQTPAVVVLPSTIDSEFDNVNENVRTYGFSLFVYEAIAEDTLQDAYNLMRTIEDDIIDLVDDTPDLGITNSDLDSNVAWINTMATNTTWSTVRPEENTEYLIMEIQLEIQLSYTLV